MIRNNRLPVPVFLGLFLLAILIPVWNAADLWAAPDEYWVHLHSFKNRDRAARAAADLEAQGRPTEVRQEDAGRYGLVWRVYVGGFSSADQALAQAARLDGNGDINRSAIRVRNSSGGFAPVRAASPTRPVKVTAAVQAALPRPKATRSPVPAVADEGALEPETGTAGMTAAAGDQALRMVAQATTPGQAAPVPVGGRVGTVTVLEGRAYITRRGETRADEVRVGTPVRQHDTIKTDQGGKLRIVFNDRSIASLGGNAQMVVDNYMYQPARKERNSRLRLLWGKVKCFVNSMAGYKVRQFMVDTPTAVIGVRGTVFVVWVIAPDVTTVAVFENKVDVWNRLRPTRVVTLDPNTYVRIGGGEEPGGPGLLTPELINQFNEGLLFDDAARFGSGDETTGGQGFGGETGGRGGGEDVVFMIVETPTTSTTTSTTTTTVPVFMESGSHTAETTTTTTTSTSTTTTSTTTTTLRQAPSLPSPPQ